MNSWTTEAGTMHSMQYQYFPHATGVAAPPLPDDPGRAWPARARRRRCSEFGADRMPDDDGMRPSRLG